MFGFWKWTEYEYRIVLFGPNYSNNSNSDRILIVSIENLDRILNTEYIRVLKMDRIRISNTTIRSSLFEYSNSLNNSDQHWFWLIFLLRLTLFSKIPPSPCAPSSWGILSAWRHRMTPRIGESAPRTATWSITGQISRYMIRFTFSIFTKDLFIYQWYRDSSMIKGLDTF